MKLLPASACVLFIAASALISVGQDVVQTGSRCQALAGATVVLADCWSVFGNQAGLAGITSTEIGGSYENRFLVNELSEQAGLIVIPVQSSAFAFSLWQFGEIPFRQGKFGIAYARKIFPSLNFGVQFNYYRLFLSEENRSAGSGGLELGFQYLANSQLVLGLHLLNPYKTGIKTLSGDFRYPSRIRTGVMYHISDSFNLIAEIENEFNSRFRLRSGLEYIIFESFILRTGISGKPYLFSAGIGFRFHQLVMDLSGSYHQYLGNSPSVSFQYHF